MKIGAEAFENGGFSVVFMDIYMDGMDGVAAAMKMRGIDSKCVPIPEFVALTGGDSRFLPINKGIIVNAEYILEFEDNCCVMENGAKFPIRVRDRLQIEQAARDYHFGKIRNHQAHFARRLR